MIFFMVIQVKQLKPPPPPRPDKNHEKYIARSDCKFSIMSRIFNFLEVELIYFLVEKIKEGQGTADICYMHLMGGGLLESEVVLV